MKVVIYGLAADPIHLGHDLIIRHLVHLYDEVWILLQGKDFFGKEMSPLKERQAMVENIIQDLPNVHIVINEYNNTWDFIRNWHCVEGVEYSFAVGLDNALTIEKWNNGIQLVSTYPFLVIGRKGYIWENEAYFHFNRRQHRILDLEIPKISSTLVRERVKMGFNVEDLVGFKNANYIRLKGLYL